jgi:hypothetical protein
MTIDCPLDCEYLQQARLRDKSPEVNPDEFPNRDVRVSEGFLRENEQLLMAASRELLRTALNTPGVVDNDIREALDSLIRTYRTLESGLYYETRPSNPVAGAVHQAMQQGFEQYRKQVTEQAGMNKVRDAEILGVLVFLQRLEIQHNNGRRRGRAFIDFLRGFFPDGTGPQETAGASPMGSPLIRT